MTARKTNQNVIIALKHVESLLLNGMLWLAPGFLFCRTRMCMSVLSTSQTCTMVFGCYSSTSQKYPWVLLWSIYQTPGTAIVHLLWYLFIQHCMTSSINMPLYIWSLEKWCNPNPTPHIPTVNLHSFIHSFVQYWTHPVHYVRLKLLTWRQTSICFVFLCCVYHRNTREVAAILKRKVEQFTRCEGWRERYNRWMDRKIETEAERGCDG